MYLVIADGIPWVDPDGISEWPQAEATALAAGLEHMGYDVDVLPA